MVSVLVLLMLSAQTLAFPSPLSGRYESTRTSVPIVAPPRPNNTGILPIPDSAHPFIAPGPNDQRGPCPGLNTLANHGYIPRNGVATFEQLVTGVTEAFNMDYDVASALAASGILARGNAFINKMSIGLQSPLVPSLPGNIDGPVAQGLAAHGRFEGDVSMTRDDFNIGDNKDFQPHLYAEFLDVVDKFGDDSPVTGPRSIVNVRAMQEIKYRRFLASQAANRKFEYHSARVAISYGEAAFTLYFFANGTDGTLNVPAMTSFFRDQKFPENHHRPSSPGTVDVLFKLVTNIYERYPIHPGANNVTGAYALDPNPLDNCSLYEAFVSNNVSPALLNTTGPLKENVNFLLEVIHQAFPNCTRVAPSSPAGA